MSKFALYRNNGDDDESPTPPGLPDGMHHLLYEEIVPSILFISGDEPGQRIQQFDSDKTHFLRKPIGVEQIKTALINLLSPV